MVNWKKYMIINVSKLLLLLVNIEVIFVFLIKVGIIIMDDGLFKILGDGDLNILFKVYVVVFIVLVWSKIEVVGGSCEEIGFV